MNVLLLVVSFLSHASLAEPAPVSIEWISHVSSGEARRVVITEEDVADNDVVLGRVIDLLEKEGLCYRGDAKLSFDRIFRRGIAWDEWGESCEDMKLVNGADGQLAIFAGPCHLGGKPEYSLTVGACASSR